MSKMGFIKIQLLNLFIAGIVAGLMVLPLHFDYITKRNEFKERWNIDENNLNATTKCALQIFDEHHVQNINIFTFIIFFASYVCFATSNMLPRAIGWKSDG